MKLSIELFSKTISQKMKKNERKYRMFLTKFHRNSSLEASLIVRSTRSYLSTYNISSILPVRLRRGLPTRLTVARAAYHSGSLFAKFEYRSPQRSLIIIGKRIKLRTRNGSFRLFVYLFIYLFILLLFSFLF